MNAAVIEFVLYALLALEVVVILYAISRDLLNFSKKSAGYLQSKFLLNPGKPNATLLEYKKVPIQQVAKHFHFKDTNALDLIFDLPESHIRDVDFTEDDKSNHSRFLFSDTLTEQQKNKLSYFSISYAGHVDFLEQVEKTIQWKSGIKKKLLILADLNQEEKATFADYLSNDECQLNDIVDQEIFWGADICDSHGNDLQYARVKKDKVNHVLSVYDEVWIFEQRSQNNRLLQQLGLQYQGKENADFIKTEGNIYEQ